MSYSAQSTKTTFFGLAQDKIYYDERKKRFFSSKDAPDSLMRSYTTSYFKERRPDLYG